MTEKKLNKKKIKQIAKMYAASALLNFGLDAFDADFTQDEDVLKEIENIALKILGDNPQLPTLPEIIKYVKAC
jgi:hypothetical protein